MTAGGREDGPALTSISLPPALQDDIAPMFAQLVTEPFQLRFHEIAQLTDRQIHDLYFHPREEDGSMSRRRETPGDIPLTPAQEFASYMSAGRMLGVPKDFLEAEWRRAKGSLPTDPPPQSPPPAQ